MNLRMSSSSSKYFSERELQCRCGCKACSMDEDFLRLLDELRGSLGRPMILTSAYRCAAHNKKVSNTGIAGPHTTGLAVDVECSGKDAHELLHLALDLRVNGIGISQKGAHPARFIHLDMLPYGNLRPWLWSY